MASLHERVGEVPYLITTGAEVVYTAEDHTARHGELWTALSGEAAIEEDVPRVDAQPEHQIDLTDPILVGRGVTALFILAEVEEWRARHEKRKTESLRRRQRRDRERRAPIQPYVLTNGEVVA